MMVKANVVDSCANVYLGEGKRHVFPSGRTSSPYVCVCDIHSELFYFVVAEKRVTSVHRCCKEPFSYGGEILCL